MVTGRINIQTTDHFSSLQKMLKDLAKKDVMIGIPEEAASRQGSNTDDINNAELLYIHTHGVRKPQMRTEMQRSIDGGMKYSAAHSLYVQEHGSPLIQVPPRPVLEPAIEDKKEIIARQLGKVSKAALDKDTVLLEAELNKAGMFGQSAAQGWFENPKNGWPENAENTKKAKGSNLPLIDTGEMRKAITYVVRDQS